MTDDDASRIVNAFDSLIKAYRKAEEDTPGDELVLSTLRKSRFLWFHKMFVKFDPYTATPLLRHYVEAHIHEQAGRIYKPLERLDTDYFTKNGTRPFKDACDVVAQYRDTTQGPWIPSILKYSIPRFFDGCGCLSVASR